MIFMNTNATGRWTGFLGILLACAAFLLHAEEPAKQPPLRELGNGLFELGSVRLDKNSRSIAFDATVNLTNVVIEYAVVTAAGKLHESLLRTEVEPYHVHLAMLLLSENDSKSKLQPVGGIPELEGWPVRVAVEWEEDGKKRSTPIENWILNKESGKTMSPGHWMYTGSRVLDGLFIAQRDGSIISIIADADALINNPREGRDNDEIWFPSEHQLPPLNTPVRVHVRFEKKE